MTVSLNQNVNVRMFVDEVQQAFQPNIADIQKLMRVKNAQGSKTVQFPLMGASVSQERQSVHTPIPIANVQTTVPEVSVRRFTVADMVDIFDKETVPYDERQELANSFALSMKRRLLQIVLDALNTASNLISTNLVPVNVSGASNGLTFSHFKRTARLLDAQGVPPSERTLLAHTDGKHNMIDDPKVASFDYNTLKVLTTGQLDGYYGLNTFWVPNMPEGGMRIGPPRAAGVRSNWAFHKNALGLAVGFMPKIQVDWVPTHGAWQVLATLMANVLVIDPLGVVEVLTDSTVESA